MSWIKFNLVDGRSYGVESSEVSDLFSSKVDEKRCLMHKKGSSNSIELAHRFEYVFGKLQSANSKPVQSDYTSSPFDH